LPALTNSDHPAPNNLFIYYCCYFIHILLYFFAFIFYIEYKSPYITINKQVRDVVTFVKKIVIFYLTNTFYVAKLQFALLLKGKLLLAAMN